MPCEHGYDNPDFCRQCTIVAEEEYRKAQKNGDREVRLFLTPEEIKLLIEMSHQCDTGDDGQGNPGWQSDMMESLGEKIREALT